MAYYDALIAKWATLTGTTEQKLATINSLTVAGARVDVSTAGVIGYLALNLKLAALFSYADNPPSGAIAGAVTAAKNLAAVLRLPSPPNFRTSDPATYATLSAAINLIASDPLSGLSAADATALMALADTTMLWRDANGYGIITDYNLREAGGLV